MGYVWCCMHDDEKSRKIVKINPPPPLYRKAFISPGSKLNCWVMLVLCLFADVPTTAQVPPLTPGTTQKMSQALLESFKSFEKDQQRLSIPKGMISLKSIIFCIVERAQVFCLSILGAIRLLKKKDIKNWFPILLK